MRHAKFLLLASLFAATAFAQSVSISVKVGARLADDLQSSGESVSESKRYTVGPTVEFKLPYRLGVGIDALYKRVSTREFSVDILGDQLRSRDRSDSWEFPILVEHRFLRKLPGPYVSGGYSFRHIAGSGTLESICCFNPYGPSDP
jgi:hypothetical protein